MINRYGKRVLLLFFCWLIGWSVSLFGFYIFIGEFPKSVYLIGYPLVTGIFSLPVSLLHSLNDLVPNIDLFHLFFIKYIMMFIGISYWPLSIYLIYRFIKHGHIAIYFGYLLIVLLSCYQWHYSAYQMSGI